MKLSVPARSPRASRACRLSAGAAESEDRSLKKRAARGVCLRVRMVRGASSARRSQPATIATT